MKKRALSLFLTLALLLMCLPLGAVSVGAATPASATVTANMWGGSVATRFGGGTGTQSDPYMINTGAQLAYLASSVNNGTTYSGKYFKLMNNINLMGREWTPIGYSVDETAIRPFSGTFDGNFATISGLKITGEHEVAGLFGCVKNATIKNLAVTNANVDVYYHYYPVDAAVLCGVSYGSTSFHKIYVDGSAKSISNKRENNHRAASGLLLGTAEDAVTLTDCYGTGTTYGEMTTAWNAYVGGLSGVFCGTMNRCYFNGSVTAKGVEDSYAGGLFGIIQDYSSATVSNSFALGTVTAVKGTKYTGGICAKWQSYAPTCTKAYYAVTCSPSGNSYGTSTSASNFASQSWITTNLGWDFTNTWTFDGSTDGYPVLRGFANTRTSSEGEFTYTVADGEATITGYTGLSANLIIPSDIDGVPVTKIGERAFFDNRVLRTVTLPNSLKEIGTYAFYRCTALADISFASGLEVIGNRAFVDCSALSELELPATVTSIDTHAFYNCTALTRVVMHNKNTAIVNTAFNNSNLTIYSYGGGAVEDFAQSKGVSFVCMHNWNFVSCTTPKNCPDCGLVDNNTMPHTYMTETVTTFVDAVQSAHPYSNSYNNTWTVTQAGASELTVTFSASTEVENNYDKIYIYNGSGTLLGTYTGTQLASKTITVPGDTVKIKLSTDYSVTNYGFYATVDAATVTTIWTERTAPTCTTAGEKYKRCSVCGHEETVVLPALGHNYDEFGVCAACTSLMTEGGFTYRIEDGGAIIGKCTNLKAYSGSATHLVIPSTLGGYPVVKIDDYAFMDCRTLQSVVIPDTVTEISDYAFYRCSNLTDITIPDSVHTIGTRAFVKCVSLASLELPASVTSVGEFAFYSCTALENLTVSNKNATIANNAFNACPNLTVYSYAGGTVQAVATEKNLPFVCLHTWQAATYETPKTCSDCGATEGDVLPRLVGTYSTDGGVTLSIYQYGDATEYHMVVSGNGPMKNWAWMDIYSYAPSIVSITIEEGITAIPVNVFKDTTALKSLTIPSTVTELPYGMCKNLTALETVVLPSTLTVINGEAFRGCTNLTEVNLPEGLTTIGYAAFLGTGLVEVNFPNSVVTMGKNVFQNCKQLESVTFGASKLAKKTLPARTFSGCTALKNLNLGTRLQIIDDYAFNQCGLETLYLPANIKTVDNAAFYKSSLKTVEIADGGATYLGWAAFYSCPNLETVDLGNSLTNISTWVFTACDSLKEITIPDTVTNIGRCSFKWCSNLETVVLSDRMTAIKDEMFVGCSKLKNVTLPSGLTSIGALAFRMCRALTSLDIPEGVTVASNAFVGSGLQ